MSLRRYKAKRDFGRTAEPEGSEQPERRHARTPCFVIQKHDASRLHYDFRLEMDGTLKSWAVPKGVPLKKGEKRLAMEVEDHPLEYRHFEGTIAPGNYGAGSVMLWDRGTYDVVGADPPSALKAGKLVIRLAGEKLNGLWTLVRMKSRPGRDDRSAWLLIKSDTDARPISAQRDDRSVSTGRTMAQIARAADRTWPSHRTSRSTATRPRPQRPTARRNAHRPPAPLASSELPEAKPQYLSPMKARLVSDLPPPEGWLFEVKLDGIRAIAVRQANSLRLFSRKPRDITADYPEIVRALRQLPSEGWVMDGEIVAMDEAGRSSFQLLQNRKRPGSARPPIAYYVFDLLNLSGRDLTRLPLPERKAHLKTFIAHASEPIRYCDSLEARPDALWTQINRLGLEGVVAKRADSVYEPGRRSGAWVKVKTHAEQEFVIGGYTPPRGTRAYFGSILVGYYQEKELRFAGKVGTGFDHDTLKDLHARFQRSRQDRCPFSDLTHRRVRSRALRGLTVAEMTRCVWLKPELVAEVKFMEWTSDGILRHPVFVGLRDDKPATEIVREKPTAPSSQRDAAD